LIVSLIILFTTPLTASEQINTILPCKKIEVYDQNSMSWSKPVLISDDETDWNFFDSQRPSITIDIHGNIHVVWMDKTPGEWGTDIEIFYANYTNNHWSNVTCISDLYGWNLGYSYNPKITADNFGNLHVVWFDGSTGDWGGDDEIFYVNYTKNGWSNATCISDIYGWNDGGSFNPNIAVDSNGDLHVVWYDFTAGEWGSDSEIMYTKYTAEGWENATVISDDSSGWNNDSSSNPSIVAVDGVVHVVWVDNTNGTWGTDTEIMYRQYTGSDWGNVTVISDDATNWNNGSSNHPEIAKDKSGNVYVVWEDNTDGVWGEDIEIMYTKSTISGWLRPTVISDDISKWNNDSSQYPDIDIDNEGNIHVVWHDYTNGEWGSDSEIMYKKHTVSGWSNISIVSDDSTGWNVNSSEKPCIAIDNSGGVHVAWEDKNFEQNGIDFDILYSGDVITSSDEQPSNNFILIPIPELDILHSLLSPIGLAVLGGVIALNIAISLVIVEKFK